MHTYSICFQLFPFKHRLIADKTVSFKILQLRFACLPTILSPLNVGSNNHFVLPPHSIADVFKMQERITAKCLSPNFFTVLELGEGLADGVYGGLGSLADDMANDFILGQTF